MEPIPAVAHAEIANAAFDARIDGRDVNRVAAAGASRTVGRDPVGIDVRPGLHVCDAIADVFRLPLGHYPAAMFSFTLAPAPVVEAEAGVSRLAELLEHQNVVLGVLQAEKTRTLNDSRPRLASLSVREVDGSAQLVAFAIEGYFFNAHLKLHLVTGY